MCVSFVVLPVTGYVDTGSAAMAILGKYTVEDNAIGWSSYWITAGKAGLF
jgi:hypothetical protein